MNRLLITRLWPVVAVAILIAFAYVYSSPEVKIQQGAQCQLVGTQTCVAVLQDRQFSARLLQEAEVEEELYIELAYPSQYELQQSYIQGINMYMGQTVLIKTTSRDDGEINLAQYMFFLGACSERNMRWQLVLLFVNPATLDEKRLFFNFQTHF